MLNGETWKTFWAAALLLPFLCLEWNRSPVENNICGCVVLNFSHIDKWQLTHF